MKPEFALFNNPHVISSPPAHQSKQANEFSTQQVEARNTSFRDQLIAAQKTTKDTMNTEDLAYIRENGLRAYAEKVHEDKREELREEILRTMNLSEEILASMDPEQRATIERLIEDEIQNRIAANSLMNSDAKENQSASSGLFGAQSTAANPVVAQLLAADQNAGTLLSKLQMLEQIHTQPESEEDQ
jgi:hypothetical protein